MADPLTKACEGLVSLCRRSGRENVPGPGMQQWLTHHPKRFVESGLE